MTHLTSSQPGENNMANVSEQKPIPSKQESITPKQRFVLLISRLHEAEIIFSNYAITDYRSDEEYQEVERSFSKLHPLIDKARRDLVYCHLEDFESSNASAHAKIGEFEKIVATVLQKQ